MLTPGGWVGQGGWGYWLIIDNLNRPIRFENHRFTYWAICTCIATRAVNNYYLLLFCYYYCYYSLVWVHWNLAIVATCIYGLVT